MFTLKFLSENGKTVNLYEGYDISLNAYCKADIDQDTSTSKNQEVGIVEVRFTEPDKAYRLTNQTVLPVGKGEKHKIAYIENSKGQTVEVVEPNRMKCFW